jgi:hypothetical protein
MIDAAASHMHLVDHLAPIWCALPDDARGTFWVSSRPLATHAQRYGITTTVGYSHHTGPATIVANHHVYRQVHGRRPIIYLELGAGQAYVEEGAQHPSYSGGGDRERVSLFLTPNATTALRERAAYPDATVAVVGSPRLDHLATLRAEPPDEQRVAFAFHWDCFPAGTLVSGPPVVGAVTRWFEGELVVLRTASGDQLACTPNHPILTRAGWTAAAAVKHGDHLIRRGDIERVMGSVHPDEQNVPAPIEEIARAAVEARSVLTVRVPVAPEDFHGDGVHGDIAVVAANGLLLNDLVYAAVAQPVSEAVLVGMGLGAAGLPSGGSLREFRFRPRCSSNRGVSVLNEGSPLRGSQALVAATATLRDPNVGSCFMEPPDHTGLGDSEFVGQLSGRGASFVGASDHGDVRSTQSGPDGRGFTSGAEHPPRSEQLGDLTLGCPEVGSERLGGMAIQVAGDEVVEICRRKFEGHVYNLETEGHWYTANGFIVHNCSLIPETRETFTYWRRTLRALHQEGHWQVAGHAHPRIAGNLARHFDRWGIPFAHRLDDVIPLVNILAVDNSSVMFEAAALDIPIVALNHPRYRRDVHHGLRFWDQIPGPQADTPDDLPGALLEALHPAWAERRAEVTERIYPPHARGHAARLAADAVLAHVGA